MNFFPFKFNFEQAVADYTKAYMDKIASPTATVAFHSGLPPDLVQEINKELTSYGLPKLANINAWKKHPGEVQVMHLDVYPWDVVNKKNNEYVPNKAAFNIPVCNTHGSRMVWYGGPYSYRQVKIVTPSGTKAVYFEVDWQGDFYEESDLELTNSHFLVTDKPHRVFANPYDTRIIASVRLQGNPSLQQIHDILYSQ